MSFNESNSMAENETPSPPARSPPIMLPESSSSRDFCVSPAPMTLPWSFFPDNDADSGCRAFSPLLAGDEWPPAVDEQCFGQPAMGTESMLEQNRLLVPEQPAIFPVPPGLVPASFLDFTPSQGQDIQSEYPPSSAAPPASSLSMQHNAPPPTPDHNIIKEPTQLPHPHYDEPAKDGFIWDWYGQRQAKCRPYPRIYYKCRHPDCPAKKRVERGEHDQITEIISTGQHNHPPAKDNSEEQLIGAWEQFTSERVFGSSDGKQVGEAVTPMDGGNKDEPESKKRRSEVQVSEQELSHRAVIDPRISRFTEKLDDGYMWVKYGETVPKGGSPYVRIYYKCTHRGCKVLKQVERDANDTRAVRTKYKGNHNHDSKKSSHRTTNAASQFGTNNAPTDYPND